MDGPSPSFRQRRASSIEAEVRSEIISDHEGNDVNLVWYPTEDRKYLVDQPPPFPFQVYFTKEAERRANDSVFARSLVSLIEEQASSWSSTHGTIHARFELYTKPFSNILGCIAHQRSEILHRNRNGIYSCLLSKWNGSYDYIHEGRILVIDRDDCLITGVVLLGYDPRKYQWGRQWQQWHSTIDIAAVESYRHPTAFVRPDRILAWKLRDWWIFSAGTWTEDDLARRNEGAVSPALYPAVDSDSHYDVEHDIAHELDGTALPPPGVQAALEELDADDEGEHILERFDRNELFLSDAKLPQLATEIYVDLLDQRVTSVWDQRLSKSRPQFSITLLPLTEASIPTISLKLDFPDFCFLHNSGSARAAADEASLEATCSLRSNFKEPITVHKKALFSHDLWYEALDLVDLATSQVLPRVACIHLLQNKYDSWLQNRELGFSRKHCPEPEHMQTLQPGQWTDMLDFDKRQSPMRVVEWLQAHCDVGVLKDTGKYALRLRDDVVIPRWTYGAVGDRKGPYNLPPLPVEMESEVQFQFEWRG